MSTSRKLLAQVRRALCAALMLAGFASLLQLALPLYALHVFESVIPAASLQTVALLALAAACAGAVLVATTAARDRIVLRAGLWLDHTLGCHILASGARRGIARADIASDTAALARLARALTDRTIVAALDAPWLPLLLLALALLDPILGTVAAAFAALLPARTPNHEDFRRYPTGATLVLDFETPSWNSVRPGMGSVLDFFVPSGRD